MTEPAPRWRTPPGSKLLWRSWDGEHVVYHCDSGNTHRLNAVAAETLELLDRAPLALPELVERIAETLGVEAEPQLARSVETLLDEFLEWGLVERIDDAEPNPRTRTG